MRLRIRMDLWNNDTGLKSIDIVCFRLSQYLRRINFQNNRRKKMTCSIRKAVQGDEQRICELFIEMLKP